MINKSHIAQVSVKIELHASQCEPVVLTPKTRLLRNEYHAVYTVVTETVTKKTFFSETSISPAQFQPAVSFSLTCWNIR